MSTKRKQGREKAYLAVHDEMRQEQKTDGAPGGMLVRGRFFLVDVVAHVALSGMGALRFLLTR